MSPGGPETNLIGAFQFQYHARFIGGGNSELQSFNDLAHFRDLCGSAFGQLAGPEPE